MRAKTLTELWRRGQLRLLLRATRLATPYYRVAWLAAASRAGLLQRLADGAVPLDRLALYFAPDAGDSDGLRSWLDMGVQLRELEHRNGAYALRGFLARKLAEISPGSLEKVLFATGGSDAMEIALKVARVATGRFKTLSFWDAFHGAGFGAASVGGEQLFRSGAIGPLLPGSEHVAPFACYRCPYGHPALRDGQPDLERCRLSCANMVRYVLEREGDVAAVVAEPNRAVPYVAPPGFWREVRRACDEHGALLIFDEIPTGLGKTGRMFACEHDEVEPDILVLGKALGGGILPIAATLCRAELDVGGAYAFGHYTHEKNPVTSRAALTTLEIIEDEGLVEHAAMLGVRALDRLREMKARYPLIGDVRGRGLLMGVELVSDRDSKAPAEDAAEAIYYLALDRGLSFKISMGNVFTLTPPLVTSVDEMDRALAILDECFAEVSVSAATKA